MSEIERVGAMEARLRVAEEQLVRLEAKMGVFVENINRLLPKIEAMIEGRSGEDERDKTLVRDINSAHEKIRAMDARQDRMESRQNRQYWMMIGGLGTLQILFAVVTWLIEHRHIFGGH